MIFFQTEWSLGERLAISRMPVRGLPSSFMLTFVRKLNPALNEASDAQITVNGSIKAKWMVRT